MSSNLASERRRSRELVLRGLYQRQLSGNADAAIRADLLEGIAEAPADRDYLEAVWRGVTRDYESLLEAIAPHSARTPAELSPIERAILVIGAYELANHVDVPYRVVINEAVELAKDYGGIDGHRYVNGVLDKLAARLRAAEIAALADEARR